MLRGTADRKPWNFITAVGEREGPDVDGEADGETVEYVDCSSIESERKLSIELPFGNAPSADLPGANLARAKLLGEFVTPIFSGSEPEYRYDSAWMR
jgi:hypothetical protein